MGKGRGIGMALLATGCSREVGVVAGMTAGQAACRGGRCPGGRSAVTGIAVGCYVKRSRSPDRCFLLEVTVDVGAGGVGQIGDRGQVDENPLVIPGTQGS